jgi:hypothetical protein
MRRLTVAALEACARADSMVTRAPSPGRQEGGGAKAQDAPCRRTLGKFSRPVKGVVLYTRDKYALLFESSLFDRDELDTTGRVFMSVVGIAALAVPVVLYTRDK